MRTCDPEQQRACLRGGWLSRCGQQGGYTLCPRLTGQQAPAASFPPHPRPGPDGGLWPTLQGSAGVAQGKQRCSPSSRGPGDAPGPPGAAETSGSSTPCSLRAETLEVAGPPRWERVLSSLRPFHVILTLDRLFRGRSPGRQRPSKEHVLEGVSTGSAVALSPFLLSL